MASSISSRLWFIASRSILSWAKIERRFSAFFRATSSSLVNNSSAKRVICLPSSAFVSVSSKTSLITASMIDVESSPREILTPVVFWISRTLRMRIFRTILSIGLSSPQSKRVLTSFDSWPNRSTRPSLCSMRLGFQGRS